ncbi:Pumilio-family RNA binding repeat protein [Candida albicans]|uniref:Pumilio-family RNA binding repeat protein n=1 Tax=Candida albicans TaxID=5476 RepID=A0A8H6C585_CANAX|nr:Pumilio-family RNA binding repeat protein [Candida albicans]
MSNMPPPLPPHSMGLPSFSPFPHPSFYQGYIPSPPAHTPTPAPPIIQESQVPTPAPVPVPAPQPNQPQPPTMWNPLHSPLVRLPFGQQQLQTVYSPTQSTQSPLLPQQGPPQPQPAFPMMPQHNFHQHNQYHPRPHYRNNNGMMNVHRKNLRRKEDSAKYSDAKLQDFTGSILTLCKDQHGCRFLQRELINETNATLIFNEIYFKAVELMIDPFGNYLIQKLFTMINLEQRLVLINQCSNELFRIALDPHGTRSLQKLIDVIETNEEIEIITRNLYSNIVVLSRDLNGNHVVQKILTKFNTISSDSNSSDSNRDGASIKTKINSFLILFKPIFYILLVIDMGVVYYRGVWIMGTNNNVNNYHKRLPSILSNYLWIHMVITLYNHGQAFNQLLNDPFGNYVLQTSLDVANLEQFEQLSKILLPLLPNIKSTPHGRRILNKIQQ